MMESNKVNFMGNMCWKKTRRLAEGGEDESKEGRRKQETKTSQKSKMASLVGDSRLGERYDLNLPQLKDG